MAELDLLMTSGSVEELVYRLATLDAVAGHSDEVLGEVAESAAAAQQSRTEADAARAAAQRTLDDVTARQARLEADITQYQARYDALSAPQQEVVAAHTGQSVAAAPAAAASGAAQTAVDTALAQVGDAYVWGAGGPDAFDCSGLTQYACAAAGTSLPHSSRMQATMAPRSPGPTFSRVTWSSTTARSTTCRCTSATARWCTPRPPGSRWRS
jgi:cell wall-associated NlpC family hydrolase